MIDNASIGRSLLVGAVACALLAVSGCTIGTPDEPAAAVAPSTVAPTTTHSSAPPPSPPSVAPTTTPTTTAPATTTGSPTSTTSAPATTAAAACPNGCDLPTRVAAVDRYLADRPGTIGYVLRDRVTGARYANAAAGTPVWTASTIKLAMVVDLLTRDRSGQITLTDGDRDRMTAMLNSSDDEAADALWFKYAGADHMAFNNDFPRYGLTGLAPQRGFTEFYPYWGFQKCTAEDLDRLIGYVLTQLPGADREYVVNQMQHVASDQQWGVWGAGPAASPGNKDGWSEEQGGWVINTVGFAGPDQRYTLSVMNGLNGQGGYDDGVRTVTHVAELLLADQL